MNNNKPPPLNLQTTLGKQTSLSNIFFDSRQFSGNNFNYAALFIIAVILTGFLVLMVVRFETDFINKSFVSLNSISNLTFSYSIGIVGFLIAGLAILVSIDSDDLFLIMAKTRYRKKNNQPTDLSQFQFLFFNFIKTLIYHLILLSICISTTFFTESGCFFIQLFDNFFQLSPTLKFTVNFLLTSFIILVFVRCLLSVKSFVWNLYQSVVITIFLKEKKQLAAQKINGDKV